MQAIRLLPVYDKHRIGPSEQAKRLDYLRWAAEALDTPEPGGYLPKNLDQRSWEAAQKLREQGAYLIEAGVR